MAGTEGQRKENYEEVKLAPTKLLKERRPRRSPSEKNNNNREDEQEKNKKGRAWRRGEGRILACVGHESLLIFNAAEAHRFLCSLMGWIADSSMGISFLLSF